MSRAAAGSVLRVVGRDGDPVAWLTLLAGGAGRVHVVAPVPPLPPDRAGTFAVDVEEREREVLAPAADREVRILRLDGDASDEVVEAALAVLVRAVDTPIGAMRLEIELTPSGSQPGRLRVSLRLDHLGRTGFSVRVDPAAFVAQARARDGRWTTLAVPADELAFQGSDGTYVDGVRRPLRLKRGGSAVAHLRLSLDGATTAVRVRLGGVLALVDPPADPDLERSDDGFPTVPFAVAAEAAGSAT